MGGSTEEFSLSDHGTIPGTFREYPGGSSGGSAAAVAGGQAPICVGIGHRRFDSSASVLLRHRRHEADLRTRLSVRASGLCLLARFRSGHLVGR